MTAASQAEITPFHVGNYFGGDDYLTTDVNKGVTVNRSGTRMITLTEDFLYGLHSGLLSECGDATDTVLRTCGKHWGSSVARRMDRELSEFHGRPLTEFPMAVFQACLSASFSRHGWGLLSIDLSRYDRGLLSVTVGDPPFASLIKQAKQPVEGLLAGVLAGMFSHFSGQDLDCVQTECVACGAPAAKFVLGLPARLTSVAEWVGQRKNHEAIVAQLAA